MPGCPYPKRAAAYPVGTVGTIFTSNGCLLAPDQEFRTWREKVVVLEDLHPNSCDVWIAIHNEDGTWKTYCEDGHDFDADDFALTRSIFGEHPCFDYTKPSAGE